MVNIKISPTAFLKMQTLVTGYDKEVGWYGLVEKIGSLEFRIKDILVFPQYTSGTYIDDAQDDEMEQVNWLNTLTDEQYNEKRLWGHSHVNMAVHPSSVDEKMFQRFAQTNSRASENKFAICVVVNKSMDMFWWVYDGETDKEYMCDDIKISFEVTEGMTNVEYLESTRGLVRDLKSPTSLFFRNTSRGSSMSGFCKPIMDEALIVKPKKIKQISVADALDKAIGDQEWWGDHYNDADVSLVDEVSGELLDESVDGGSLYDEYE